MSGEPGAVYGGGENQMQDVAVHSDVTYGQQPQYAQPQYSNDYSNQPAAPAPAGGYAGGDRAVGCNLPSIKRVVTSPDGILRLLEWLLAVISFGAMADQDGYKNFSAFEFLVAAGVLTWLWTMFMLVAYIFDIHSRKPIFNLVEFVGDLLWSFFEFVAGVAAAARCGKDNLCDDFAKPKAAAAFAFLCCFALLGSAFFSLKKWRNSPR